VASRALSQGFDLELLMDWMAAYGQPMLAYQNAAVVMALVYGLAVVLLESVILPAWLWPFERRRGDFVVPLLQIAIGSLLAWLLLAAVIVIMRSFVVAIGGVIAAVFLRVILNLWKCARVSSNAGLSEAVSTAARHVGAVTMLSLTTLVFALLYAMSVTVAGSFSLFSGRIVPAILLQQALILTAVLLRLWLQAATVVLWRRVSQN